MKYKLENMILNVNQITLKKEDSGELISRDEKLIAALKLLVQRYPEVVSKEELIRELWPRQVVTDWSLTRFISDMRKELGDKHNIKTVHGRGYRYTYPAEALNDNQDEEEPAPITEGPPFEASVTQAAAPLESFRFHKRKYLLIAITVLGLTAGGIGLLFTQLVSGKRTPEPTLAELMGTSDGKPVIAILPVVDSASRYETGLAMASLLNGMFKLHDGVHVVDETIALQLGSASDLTSDKLGQHLAALCAKAGCMEVILLHYVDNKGVDNNGTHQLSYSHYQDGKIFLSPEVVEQNPIQALQDIYDSLQTRLPKSTLPISPLLYTNNEDALLAFGEATGALANGDPGRTKPLLEAAIRMQADFHQATALLANLLLYRGIQAEARALIYSPELENASDYEKLLINIVRYRLEWYSENYQTSLMILDKINTSSATFSESITAQTLLEKGIILFELNEQRQAKMLFEQSLTLAQDIRATDIYSHALYCLAELQTKADKHPHAELTATNANKIFEIAGLTGPRSCTQRKSMVLHH